jgi:hypothetical protein
MSTCKTQWWQERRALTSSLQYTFSGHASDDGDARGGGGTTRAQRLRPLPPIQRSRPHNVSAHPRDPASN